MKRQLTLSFLFLLTGVVVVFAQPTISAQQLYNDCKNNKAKFDMDYKDRKYYITGTVGGIDATSDNYSIPLGYNVTVLYPKKTLPPSVQQKLGSMKKGESFRELVVVSSISDLFGISVYAVYPGSEIRQSSETGNASSSGNSGSGDDCYIATCVYGTYNSPELWTLRRYRDGTLSNSWLGRRFIGIYYAVSPTVVKLFGDSEWFNGLCKPVIDRIVRMLWDSGIDSGPYSGA